MPEINRPNSDEIIRNPENYAEMVEKLAAQEDRALQRVLQKHKVESWGELEEVASREIVTRALKFTGAHTAVDREQVERDPKSRDINELRSTLGEEIRAIGQRAIQALHGMPNKPEMGG